MQQSPEDKEYFQEKSPGEHKPHNSRFAYCGLFIVVASLAVVLSQVDPSSLLTKIPGTPDEAPAQQQALAVMRLSFALFVFHAIHCLATLGSTTEGDYRDKLQNGYWPLKVLALCALVVAAWAIPQPFYNVYDYIARIGGVMFTLLQILILIDFAYAWNRAWVNKDTRLYYALILICAGLALAGALTILSLLYVYYGGSECSLNNFFISFTLILGVAAVVASMLASLGALLPAGVIVSYCSFLCWSAINGVDSNCDRLAGGNDVAVLVIGAAFTVMSLCYQCLNASQSKEVLSYKAVASEGSVHESVPFFHAVFLLAALYLAMLLTGWREFGSSEIGTQGVASMWVKMVSQWVVYLLYLWSLVAPYVFKNRDFGVEI